MTYRTETLKRLSSSPFSQVANGVLRGSTRMMPSGVTRKMLCQAPALARYRSPVICVMVRAGCRAGACGCCAAECGSRRTTNKAEDRIVQILHRMIVPFLRSTCGRCCRCGPVRLVNGKQIRKQTFFRSIDEQRQPGLALQCLLRFEN